MPNAPTAPQKWNGSKWIRRDKRLSIYRRDGCRCAYCGSSTQLTLDHLIPRSKGGHNFECNLITACEGCNKSSQDKEFECFLKGIAPTNWKAKAKSIRKQVLLPLKQFRGGASAALWEQKPN